MVELSNHRTWVIGILIALNGAYFLSKRKNKHLAGGSELFGFEIPDVVCFSPSRLAAPLEQLSFSSAILVLICSLSHCLRSAVEEHVSDSLIKILLQEAIASADLCGCCFELIIADNFGVWMYGLYLFLLTAWWMRAWGNANACPNIQVEDVLLGKQDSQTSLTKIWAQLTGGIFIFNLIQYVWSLELIENHKNRAFEDCTADLQVPMWQGFFVEGGGTLICQLVSKIIADLDPKHGSLIESFIGTSMVIAAFNRTGGYFNPALATALKFGCKGNTLQEHFIVYWAGSCMGSILSVLIYHQTPLRTIFKKKEPPKQTKVEQDFNGFWDKSD